MYETTILKFDYRLNPKGDGVSVVFTACLHWPLSCHISDCRFSFALCVSARCPDGLLRDPARHLFVRPHCEDLRRQKRGSDTGGRPARVSGQKLHNQTRKLKLKNLPLVTDKCLFFSTKQINTNYEYIFKIDDIIHIVKVN